MTYKVVFKPQANQDLDEIFSFILNHGGSADRALDYVERILSFCNGFVTFPHRGTKRDDIRAGLRLVGFERRATIAFSIEGDMIIIARIFYAGRDIELIEIKDDFLTH
jgi:toxin ParE1/3/4